MIHSLQQARKLLLTLICIELLLVVVYGTDAWVQGPAGQLNELINLDGEGNLPGMVFIIPTRPHINQLLDSCRPCM